MQTREITVWAHSYIKNIKARYLEHCKTTLPEDNGFILKSRDCWKVPFHYARRYSTLEQQPSKTPYLFVIYIKNQQNLTHLSVYQITRNMTWMLSILLLKRYQMCWKLSMQHCKNVFILLMALVPSTRTT